MRTALYALAAAAALTLGGCTGTPEPTQPASPCADPAESVPCMGPGNTWIGDGSARTTAPPPPDTMQQAAESASASTKAVEPIASDFDVELTVTDRQCDAGGCDYTAAVKVKYLGPNLPPQKTYVAVYEVPGTKPLVVRSVSITGFSLTYQTTERFSAPADIGRPTPEVTSVDER